jgi:hypothetical protein
LLIVDPFLANYIGSGHLDRPFTGESRGGAKQLRQTSRHVSAKNWLAFLSFGMDAYLPILVVFRIVQATGESKHKRGAMGLSCHPASVVHGSQRSLMKRILVQCVRSLWLVLLFNCGVLSAEPVPVRHREGTIHGFLLVRTLQGAAIAIGDLVQVPRGDQITSRLTFHFKDGSIDDETTVYSQRVVFRLISDHHVQKGPSFPHPIDLSIETSTGQVTVHFTDNEGKDRVTTDHFDFPDDLANGLIPTLLKNIRPNVPESKVSFLTAGPKPLLVKLAISPSGEERFSLGGSQRRAIRYIVKVEIGGILGLLAPAMGNQPPDTNVWIFGGEAPTFLKWQGVAYQGGPIWTTELASPSWQQTPRSGQ